MAGILTARELERAGIHTVVLEAGRIGSGQTKNTTAKITSQHSMFCSEFLEKKGRETAGKNVRASEETHRTGFLLSGGILRKIRTVRLMLCVRISDAALCRIRTKDHGTAPAMGHVLITWGIC